MWAPSLASLSGLRIWRCHVGHRCGLDPALLWLWCRLTAAAPIQPLAWELPYAAGTALKDKKAKTKHKKLFLLQGHQDILLYYLLELSMLKSIIHLELTLVYPILRLE